MREMRVHIRLLWIAVLLALGFAGPALAQIPEAMTVSGLDNQIYIGYEHTHFDYELLTPTGDKPLNNNGINVQYNYRNMQPFRMTGRVSYGSGAVEGQKLITVAGGGGIVIRLWKFEPYGEALAGMSRLTSTDNIYLSQAASTKFTYILSAGVDYTLSGRWGVRPIYVENQYFGYGPNGSQYMSYGAGVLYRFGSKEYGRHRNGR